MRTSIPGRVLLVSACILAGAAGWAQQSQKPAPPAVGLDRPRRNLRHRALPGGTQTMCCFWFKGGGADAAFTFWKGWGIAASLTGDHASNVTPGSG